MRLEARSVALGMAAVACASAAVVGWACIVAPPPELPQEPYRAPRILHESVWPPEGVPLGDSPGDSWMFTIPVEVDPRLPSFQYEVLVIPGRLADGQELDQDDNLTVSPSALDAGQTSFSITIEKRKYDLRICHTIRVIVALHFQSLQVPDDNGGDSVFWTFQGSGAPYSCPTYDAGPFQNGAFPPVEAGDSLIIPADSGVDP